MRWNNRVLKCALASLAAAGSFVAAQPAPPAPATRFVVVIDAAHGGDDPGGRLNGTDEKTLTLALSVRLRSLLAARGIQVLTTRESDATIDPNRRAELANHAKAEACLSLHATLSGIGAHLFVSSLTPTQPARIAAWKTAQSAWVTRSLALAGTLNSALLHTGLTVSLTRAALPAVDSMTCPAVAVEIAPETAQARDPGQQTSGALDDPNYQARIAEALAAALLEWRTDALRTEARP
jgi:N-acetylmuramoyl-L-alanine amidase